MASLISFRSAATNPQDRNRDMEQIINREILLETRNNDQGTTQSRINKPNKKNQIQTIENYVYKQILKSRSHAATSAIRGDIGSSLIETRIIQTRLMLVSSILQ